MTNIMVGNIEKFGIEIDQNENTIRTITIKLESICRG